jgi:hypothetical protein
MSVRFEDSVVNQILVIVIMDAMALHVIPFSKPSNLIDRFCHRIRLLHGNVHPAHTLALASYCDSR